MIRSMNIFAALCIGLLASLHGSAQTVKAEEAVKAEEPNAVTAIDIVLEPDATMVQHAEAANERLRKEFPKGFVLGKTHHPHISCLQRYVKTDLRKPTESSRQPQPLRRGLARYENLRRAGNDLADDQMVLFSVEQHGAAPRETPGEHFFRQQVLDVTLDGSPERPGPHGGVVADLHQEFSGLGGKR